MIAYAYSIKHVKFSGSDWEAELLVWLNSCGVEGLDLVDIKIVEGLVATDVRAIFKKPTQN